MNRIRVRRLELGYTQQKLGEAIGYRGPTAQVFIARWESGEKRVPRDKLIKVSKLLKIPIKELIQ